MKRLFVGVFLLGFSSCADRTGPSVASVYTPQVEPRLPVCLVLSVGAEAGLSHIGVIRAVRERGVPVDCVVGSSMGALVGGLYSANPNVDVAYSYRKLANDYKERASAEGSNAQIMGLVLGALAGASAGGTLLAGGIVGAGLGASSVAPMEWRRLRAALRAQLEGVSLELLPVRFASLHHTLTRSGAEVEVVTRGELADAVAASIANPLLFPDLKIGVGKRIDPGLDQVSSVPVDAACGLFPGHQLLVSNVANQPIFSSPTCPYQEVVVPALAVDAAAAMSAKEPEFTRLIDVGYHSAHQQIDWSLLPDSNHPSVWSMASAGVFHVRATLSIQLSATKQTGVPWDFGGGLPDIQHETRVILCDGCEAYGTSASHPTFKGKRSDTTDASWDLGVLHLRPGMWLTVSVQDADLVDHDRVGEFRLVFDGVRPEAYAYNDVARVTVRFEQVRGHAPK